MPAGADASKALRRGSDEGGTLDVGGWGEVNRRRKRGQRGEERGTNGTAARGCVVLHAARRACGWVM